MEDSITPAELQHDRQQSATDAAQARWHEAALEDVLGVVLEHWQWPKPVGDHTPAQIDLQEWLTEHYDAYGLADIVAHLLDDALRYDMENTVINALKAHLSTSDIVAERVAVLLAEELQERQ